MILSFLMVGCSSNSPVSTTPEAGDTTAPTLVSTAPVDGSTDLDINETIVATFSEPLDSASLSGNITISPGIVTDLVLTGNDVQIVHNPFNYDDEITISFATGLTDTAGNHLAAQETRQYWVGSNPADTTPPTITGITPEAGSIDLDINEEIVASFSEPLDETTLMGNITISPGTVTDLIMTGNDVQIVHNPFNYDDEITITFSVGLTDAAGNHLESPVSYQYQVESEELGPCEDIEFSEYYTGVDVSSPETLRATLHQIIDDHQRFPYTSGSTDTWNVLEEADQDPNNPARILDLYGNYSYIKHGGGNNDYNREHTWPKSYGFPDDGSSNYPYTDCHHLFLCNDSYNSSRSNHPYGTVGSSGDEKPTQVNDGVGGGYGSYPGFSNWRSSTLWETWIDRRGDVARAMFYMDVRYEGGNHGTTGATEPDLVLTNNISLIVVTGSNTAGIAYMGLLDDLISWHLEDPVDDNELYRHEAVFARQGNRNPFIDYPELVECLFAP